MPIIHETYSNGYITSENSREFSKELYLHQNNLVHGKADYSLNLKIPNVIQDANELFWNCAIKNIALVLIEKYCL